VFIAHPNVRIQVQASFVTENFQAFVITRVNSWLQPSQNTRCEVFTLVTTNICVTADKTLCSLIDVSRRFSEICCLHHQGSWKCAHLLPQKCRKTLFQATRRHAPQDDVLHPRNRSLPYKVTTQWPACHISFGAAQQNTQKNGATQTLWNKRMLVSMKWRRSSVRSRRDTKRVSVFTLQLPRRNKLVCAAGDGISRMVWRAEKNNTSLRTIRTNTMNYLLAIYFNN
jgi:hypothetical protein